MKRTLIIFICAGLMACTNTKEVQTTSKEKANIIPFKHLALGDSYTIGEMVEKSDSWPMQLNKKILEAGKDTVQTTILAKTGWTADELFKESYILEPTEKFDLVTIQIGVNNQFQKRPISEFKTSFLYLIELAMGKSKNGTKSIYIISIPDYSVSPFAKEMDRKKIRKEIEEYNQLSKQLAGEFGIKFINITDISQKALNEPELFTKDRLHPVKKMYSMWAEHIFLEIKDALN